MSSPSLCSGSLGGWGCQMLRPKPKSQPALMTQMLHLLPHKGLARSGMPKQLSTVSGNNSGSQTHLECPPTQLKLALTKKSLMRLRSSFGKLWGPSPVLTRWLWTGWGCTPYDHIWLHYLGQSSK